MPIKVDKACNSVLLLYLPVIKSGLAKRSRNYILLCHHSIPSTVFFLPCYPFPTDEMLLTSRHWLFSWQIFGGTTFLGFTNPFQEIAMPDTLNQHHNRHLHIPLLRTASYTELLHCEKRLPRWCFPVHYHLNLFKSGMNSSIYPKYPYNVHILLPLCTSSQQPDVVILYNGLW